MNKVEIGKLDTLEYSINEAYKTLRTNISFCGDSVKVILLTSCTPNEGKSTVGMRLSQALAEDNKKVILIDADLRKSVLVGRHGITSAQPIKGLSHYLSGQAKLEDTICATNIENMFAIFAGPVTPNPTELLGNHYFESMINSLREEYDYIIIDAPPLGSVIDAAILTKWCDGTILVIESNAISYRFAQDVKKQLEIAECKILGVILNKVDTSHKGYYSGYYNGYYKKRYYGGKYKRYGYYGRYEKYGEYGNDSE
ncbi:MAG: polysaccharide biosynthesis tyrosine autokinase [Lachnospiraceae bacterium]|nr:polysaccharide biosynthesis tyrosine autokinase [Lachnospiraceae bacterium]